jgi:hypothetical protein
MGNTKDRGYVDNTRNGKFKIKGKDCIGRNECAGITDSLLSKLSLRGKVKCRDTTASMWHVYTDLHHIMCVCEYFQTAMFLSVLFYLVEGI